MRVLVADKDPTTRTVVSTCLAPRHYEVIEQTESEAALAYLDKEKVDLIMVSTEMERVAGRHLVEQIRQRQHLRMVPVIMLAEADRVSFLLMNRTMGFDDFILKPFNSLLLQLRAAINLEKTRERMEANALTHLPGNHAIEKYILSKIAKEEKFSVLYIDIGHFKAFNDRYGFEKGDDVIHHTAKLLIQNARDILREGEYFVGHIGGDDFVVVMDPAGEEEFAWAFIADFDRIIPTYYSPEDQKQKSIRVTNRRGKKETVPLMNCSVAACNNLYYRYKNLGEIARDAAQVKAFLKSQPGSRYMRNRRSEPITKLEEALEILTPEPSEKKETPLEDKPLGKMLLEAGLIDSETLDAGLKKHFVSGQRLGRVLIGMRAVTPEDVGGMLEKKHGVPFVCLSKRKIPAEAGRIFSADFMKVHRVVPLETADHEITLGMCDPFDGRAVEAVRQITGMKPKVCWVLEDDFEGFMGAYEEECSHEGKAG